MLKWSSHGRNVYTIQEKILCIIDRCVEFQNIELMNLKAQPLDKKD